MFAAKPLASLSSGLLARKGQARPAMRPQPISFGMAASEDDLGWNDMGEAPGGDAQPAAEVPPVLVERATLVREVEAAAEPQPTPVPEPAKRVSPATAARLARESAALTTGHKAAFTLRLDADRHLRLRLSAALAGRSAQQLVTEALDAFLSQQSGLDALVAGLPQSARKRS
jgi:hypothetical protein